MTAFNLNSRQVIYPSGTAALPTYTFLNNNKNGMYLAGTNSLGLATNGTAALVLSSTGAVTTGTWQATAVGIAYGGTGQTTASAGFNALSPITSTGDLIIGNGTNSATRLAIGANTYVLTSNGTTATWSAPASSGATKGQAITFSLIFGL